MVSETPSTPVVDDGAVLDQLLVSSNSYSDLFSVLPAGAIDPQGQEKTVYQCNCCGNRYGRVDHAKRHCRSRESVLPSCVSL